MSVDSSHKYFLTMLETTGNQDHIFQTNKLAENIGASQQLVQIGQQDVIDAVHPWLPNVGDVDDVGVAEKNPPIEDGKCEVEIWYLSSGKALLFTKDQEIGQQVVQSVTRKALTDYPGLVVRGAIVEITDWSVRGLAKAVENVHRKMAKKRSQLPPAEARFQRLPIVAECKISGLPACGEEIAGVAVSRVVVEKRKAMPAAKSRLDSLAERASVGEDKLRFELSIDRLEEWLTEHRFLAVIHADGTGFGQLFQKFVDLRSFANVREYVNDLRAFSMALDKVTQAAFVSAVRELADTDERAIQARRKHREWTVPILPLILGGDDLTLIMRADLAVNFLKLFLGAWEKAIADCAVIATAAQEWYQIKRLGMAAGIAIVKPHFPFSIAYNMAEELASSAKQEIKSRCKLPGENARVLPLSAFDVHVHRSASGDDVGEIRRALELSESLDGNTSSWRVWGGPYLVTDAPDFSLCNPNPEAWFEHRTAASLAAQMAAISATDDDNRHLLPNSQLHEIRSALFEGPAATAAQVELIRHRYGDFAWNDLLPDSAHASGPFWQDCPAPAEKMVTSLLDAMSLLKIGTTVSSKDNGDEGNGEHQMVQNPVAVGGGAE